MARPDYPLKQKEVMYRVEIFCMPRNILTLDFGNFAIIVEYDWQDDLNLITVYSGEEQSGGFLVEDYSKIFMGDICLKIKEEDLQAVKIPLNVFLKIKGIYKKYRQRKYCEQLWELLKKNFRSQVSQYFL
jgi:hypothetical protein